MTSVILVDDHALIRRGMRDALAEEGLQVAGEASCWAELEPLLAAVHADVLVLDLQLPGVPGHEILQRLAPRAGPPILVVSMYPEDPHAVQAIRAGAAGYLTKAADTADLVQAIRAVAQGGRWIGAETLRLLGAGGGDEVDPALERLGARERLLLALIAQGLRLPEIAQRMGLPDRSVGVLRARLMDRLKASSNAELAHQAARMGLVPAA